MKHSLLQQLLPDALRQRLSILIFHRVLDAKDAMMPSEPSREEFEWMMALLRRRFNPMPLHEALTRLNTGSLPPLSVCVTFDDGYRDNLINALPIMERHDVPGTIFVSTGSLDGGRMWNDTVTEAVRRWPEAQLDLSGFDLGVYAVNSIEEKRQAAQAINSRVKYFGAGAKAAVIDFLQDRSKDLPDNLMLKSEEVRELTRRGVEIGAHTVSHPILAELSSDDSVQEIVRSKSTLETITNGPIRLFAYPNGKANTDYSAANVAQCREAGFDYALSTNWGVATPESHQFEVPRFTPWDRAPAKFGLRLVQNLLRTRSELAAL